MNMKTKREVFEENIQKLENMGILYYISNINEDT